MKPVQARLIEVADVQLGITLRGTDAARHDPEGTHQLVRIGDISEDGDLVTSSVNLIKLDEVAAGKFALRAGEVLLASRGTRMPSTVFDGRIKAVAGSQFCVIRPHAEALLPEYLRWFFNLPSTQEALHAMARGSYIRSLPIGSLSDLTVPVPSLARQRLIADLHALRLREKHIMAAIAAKRAILIEGAVLQSLRT